MTVTPDPAEAYVRLAHAIDAHEEGFVDGYGGPQQWAVFYVLQTPVC